MNAYQFRESIKKRYGTYRNAAITLGVTEQTISNWCNGIHSIPRPVVLYIETLEKIDDVH